MSQVVLQLNPIAYKLLLLRLSGWVGLCLLASGAAFALLEILEKIFIFKEATAFFINAIVIIFAALVTLTGFVRIIKRQPRLTDLANRVEQAHPDLMDSLNAAVEVVRIPTSKRSTIERLLVDSVAEKTSAYNLDKLLIPRWLSFFSLSGLFLSGLILLVFAHSYDVSQKFRFQLGDWVRGESTAFFVNPKLLEVARNEDLRVLITPRRWDQQCVIEFIENGELVRFPMNSTGDNQSEWYHILICDRNHHQIIP